MKFFYQSTINVPVKFAFKRLTDFERFENEGFGNMSKFEPVGDVSAPNIGARWKIRAEFQGRKRTFALSLRELATNEKMVLGNGSDKFDVEAQFDFADLAPEQTGFCFEINASAKTITGRLIIQTMQLARARIEKKLAADFDAVRARLESEYKGN